MSRYFTIGLMLLSLGCSNPNAEKMQGSGPTEPWLELNDFQSGPLMSIGYPAEKEDWDAVKAAASSEEFKSSVAALEKSTPPSGYNKDILVNSLNDLTKTAETGDAEEVKSKYEAVQDAMNKVTSE